MTIGQFNVLTVLRVVPPGVILGDADGDVLLPRRYAPEDAQVGEEYRVFVYTDSEDRPVATTQIPIATAGEFAFVRVVSTGPYGAFADWGLDKDLLIPHAQQRSPLADGRSYVVRILLDEVSNRIIGSTKLSKFLLDPRSGLRQGQPVEILPYRRIDRGTMVIVDRQFSAFLPEEEVVIGRTMNAYVLRIREDGKVAVTTNPQGYSAIMGEGPKVLAAMRKAGGFLPFSDSSSPEDIRRAFGMSKGAFKKLIGGLMRDGHIEITYHGIRLLS